MIFIPGFLLSQTYDLQFIEELNNGSNFNVRVQIKASSNFLMASSNIAFNFNSAGINNPTLLAAYNFSGNSYDSMFITQPNTGVVYINLHYLSYDSSASATTVGTDWMDVASIGFTVTNTGLTSNLIFRSANPSNSIVYSCSGANPMIFTQQTAGTWFTLDNLLHGLLVNAKVYLEGPYSGGGVMTTTLNTNNLIPLNSNAAYSTATYGYTSSTVGSIPNASIVDWVLLN